MRWYLRFGLSYRDVEELLAERGVEVDHTTLFRWVVGFTPLFIEVARPARHTPGDRWFVDETYVKVLGRWRYLYRALDQFGQVVDVLVSPTRDKKAARRFFTRAGSNGTARCASSPPGTHSCRTCGAATTNSGPKWGHATLLPPRSSNSPSPTDRPGRSAASAWPALGQTQQCPCD